MENNLTSDLLAKATVGRIKYYLRRKSKKDGLTIHTERLHGMYNFKLVIVFLNS